MTSSVPRFIAALAALAASFSLGVFPEAASAKGQMPKAAPLSQSYTWYDGNKPRTVYLNPKLVAEFDVADEAQSQVARTVDAKPVARKGVVRIWEVEGGAERAIASVRAATPRAEVSPVFHDNNTDAGRMRALTGNIIVYLDPQWGEVAVEQFLARNNLVLVKKLEIGPNIFVVKDSPGLAALEKANALYQSGEVIAAFPEWWQEVTTR